MARYIVRRLLSAAVVLWAVITATFLLMHAIKGGPFDRERVAPLAVQKAIEERYRLNDPIWRRYLDYLSSLARLDLGPSLKSQGQSVNDIIARGFPVSAALGFCSIALSLCVGIPLGMVAALRRNRLIDHASMTGAIALVSVPSFVLASLLIFLFANRDMFPALAVLPPSWGGGAALPGETTPLSRRLPPLVIPVLSLSAFSLAYIARLTRAGFVDALSQDYMRTARAKGLGPFAAALKHGLRNAVSPVTTYLGPLTAGVFTGSFVIERIYDIPGLGRHFVTGIYNRDYPVIMGVTVFYCGFLVLMNLAVDLAYPWIDPRVSLDDKGD